MAKKEITYTEAMNEIEQILDRFRREEMTVDSLTKEVKRATELIALCKERLHRTEEELKKSPNKMKRLIRWALNHLPRTFLHRIAGISVPVLGWFYIGRGVECPVCGTRRRKFLPYGYVHSRPNALCPRCLSLERHRLLWLYLQRETDLPTAYPRILHIAPEVCLMRKLRKHYDGHPGLYLTADLESPLADMHFDVQHIPLEDDFTDVVICNHILEHVEDDRQALRELHRILKPGGWGVVLSPMDFRAKKPSKTTRSPIRLSEPAFSASTTTGASTAATTPTGCAVPDSKSPTSTSPPRSPKPNAVCTPCPTTIFTSFTKSGNNRLPARFPAGTDRASSPLCDGTASRTVHNC